MCLLYILNRWAYSLNVLLYTLSNPLIITISQLWCYHLAGYIVEFTDGVTLTPGGTLTPPVDIVNRQKHTTVYIFQHEYFIRSFAKVCDFTPNWEQGQRNYITYDTRTLG